MLKNSKRMISILEIDKRYRNNNIVKKEYTSSIHFQILSLANILLNSKSYTM